MSIYIFVFLISLLLGYGEYFGLRIKLERNFISLKKVSFWVIFLFLLLIGILRSPDIGYDTETYYKDYFLISSWPIEKLLHTRQDPIFYLLIKFLRIFKDDYVFVRSAIYTLTLSVYAIYLKKKSYNYGFSFALYVALMFIGFNFGILRQALAVALMSCSWKAMEEKKIIKFFIFLGLAFINHSTAIFFLPVFVSFLLFKKISIWTKVLVIPISLLILNFILPRLISIYQGGIYLNEINKRAGYFQLALYTSIVLLLLFFYLKAGKIRGDTLFDIMVWCTLIQVLALNLPIFARMNVYLWSLMTVECTNTRFNKKNEFIIIQVLIYLFSIIFLYSLWKNSQLIVPYKFFWQT
jgi:membrane protein|nr:EpsG family protein [uncultured Oribacterium sp.]